MEACWRIEIGMSTETEMSNSHENGQQEDSICSLMNVLSSEWECARSSPQGINKVDWGVYLDL